MDTPTFADGLGRRVPGQGTSGERLESLRLCAEVADASGTQAALVERAARLSDFQHPAFARVRRIEHLSGVVGGLAIVSDAVAGVRLSDVLRHAERRALEPDLDAALFLARQVVSAVAALHAHSRDTSHGAIGPERIIVAPDGSVTVTEYVLASALEQLQLSRSQLWALFRVPVPSVAGAVRFDQQTDVIQLGVLTLSLVLGRVLRRDEFPQRLPGLLEEAATLDACGERRRGLSRPVRSWVARALQLDSRSAFRSAIDADTALAAAISEDGARRPSAAAVQALLERCAIDSTGSSGSRARNSPSGSTVTIAPRPDTTGRLPGSRQERELDRGSGAHRVSRGGPEREPTAVQVLAELSPVDPAGSTPPSVAPPVVPIAHETRLRSGQPRTARWSALLRALRVGVVVIGLVVLWGASYLTARTYLGLPSLATSTGTLIVESRPAGAELMVDGTPGGRTPATLQLPAGRHTLRLRAARQTAVVPVTVVAGRQTVERVELHAASRPTRRR